MAAKPSLRLLTKSLGIDQLRYLQAKAAVRAFRIVKVNGLLSGPCSREKVRKTLVEQILQFQNAIHSFGHGVVVGIATPPPLARPSWRG